MKKKISLVIIIIIFTNLLIACWDKRELTELSIVSAVGIDKVKDEYLVNVQIINPSEITGQKLSERAEILTYESKGKTIFEALRKLTRDTPRKPYLGHLMIIVISEELAREGIIETLDFFSRDHEFRTDFYIVVAKENKAKDILNVLTPIDKIPAEKIHNGLEMAEDSWAPVKTISLDELISYIVNVGKNPVLPGITLIGDKENGGTTENISKTRQGTIIRVNNLAVFNDDKLIGWLTENESRGYNAIIDNINNNVVAIPCEEKGYLSVEILRTKTKLKAKIKNGRPLIDIVHELEGDIADIECEIDIENEDDIRRYEKKLENQIQGYLYSSVEKAKSYKTDIFGFGLEIYRKYPHEFKKIEKNWDNEFVDLDVNIKVKANIRGTGTTKDIFTDKIDTGVDEDER